MAEKPGAKSESRAVPEPCVHGGGDHSARDSPLDLGLCEVQQCRNAAMLSTDNDVSAVSLLSLLGGLVDSC